MDVWKVILEGKILLCACQSRSQYHRTEKYDDLRTWLAADDRQAIDHFAQDLLKEISVTCRR